VSFPRQGQGNFSKSESTSVRRTLGNNCVSAIDQFICQHFVASYLEVADITKTRQLSNNTASQNGEYLKAQGMTSGRGMVIGIPASHYNARSS
jgi:hypothetical protein